MSSPNTKTGLSEVRFRQVSLHYSVYYYSVECMLVCFICLTWVHIRHWCEFESRSWGGVFDTTLCDKVCQWIATGWWFSPGTPVSSTNKTDRHDMTEILLKVVLNTINQINHFYRFFRSLLWSPLYGIFDPMTYCLRGSMFST